MITIGFRRFGNGIFVPHVDVLRSLNRTFRRAGIDVAYSNGFNRHMSLKLTQPLPFGIADDDGYVTADVPDGLSPEEVVARFNACCPPFLRAGSAYVTEQNPSLAGIVDASAYTVKGRLTTGQVDKINSLPDDYAVTVKRKNGEERVPVKDMIFRLEAGENGFAAVLAFGNVNLRIDRLCEQLNADFGTEFEVTDAVRNNQAIKRAEGMQTAAEYLEEICQCKFLSN